MCSNMLVSRLKSLNYLGTEVQEKNHMLLWLFISSPYSFIHRYFFKPYRKAIAQKEKHTLNIYWYVFENHLEWVVWLVWDVNSPGMSGKGWEKLVLWFSCLSMGSQCFWGTRIKISLFFELQHPLEGALEIHVPMRKRIFVLSQCQILFPSSSQFGMVLAYLLPKGTCLVLVA